MAWPWISPRSLRNKSSCQGLQWANLRGNSCSLNRMLKTNLPRSHPKSTKQISEAKRPLTRAMFLTSFTKTVTPRSLEGTPSLLTQISIIRSNLNLSLSAGRCPLWPAGIRELLALDSISNPVVTRSNLSSYAGITIALVVTTTLMRLAKTNIYR